MYGTLPKYIVWDGGMNAHGATIIEFGKVIGETVVFADSPTEDQEVYCVERLLIPKSKVIREIW